MKPINISSLIKKYGPGYVAKNKKSGKKSDITISWIPKGGARYVF